MNAVAVVDEDIQGRMQGGIDEGLIYIKKKMGVGVINGRRSCERVACLLGNDVIPRRLRDQQFSFKSAPLSPRLFHQGDYI